MLEFSAGLQTRQEERYVILLFLLLLRGGGGVVLQVFHDNCASDCPFNREKLGGGMCLFRTMRLIGRIWYILSQFKAQYGNK